MDAGPTPHLDRSNASTGPTDSHEVATHGQLGPSSRAAAKTRRDSRRVYFPDIYLAVDLTSYCVMLQMIRERLDDLVSPDDDPWTALQRKRWEDARRFLKAASTSMGRLMDAALGVPDDL